MDKLPKGIFFNTGVGAYRWDNTPNFVWNIKKTFFVQRNCQYIKDPINSLLKINLHE